MTTEFKVLGPLEVINGNRDCTPSPAKLRMVLACLLLNANYAVSVNCLIDELWDHDPPKTAVTTAQTYIYQLRRMVAREKLAGPDSELIVTRSAGCVLRIEPRQLDANVFNQLVQQGRADLGGGRPGAAAAVLRNALGMWTGPVLADVTRGRLMEGRAVALGEQRQYALELRIEADLRLGQHREMIGELRSLVAIHPFNEWFHSRLIAALSRAGRRSEALQAYQALRVLLKTELGLEPTPDLLRLQQEVLGAGTPGPEMLARSCS